MLDDTNDKDFENSFKKKLWDFEATPPENGFQKLLPFIPKPKPFWKRYLPVLGVMSLAGIAAFLTYSLLYSSIDTSNDTITTAQHKGTNATNGTNQLAFDKHSSKSSTDNAQKSALWSSSSDANSMSVHTSDNGLSNDDALNLKANPSDATKGKTNANSSNKTNVKHTTASDNKKKNNSLFVSANSSINSSKNKNTDDRSSNDKANSNDKSSSNDKTTNRNTSTNDKQSKELAVVESVSTNDLLSTASSKEYIDLLTQVLVSSLASRDLGIDPSLPITGDSSSQNASIEALAFQKVQEAQARKNELSFGAGLTYSSIFARPNIDDEIQVENLENNHSLANASYSFSLGYSRLVSDKWKIGGNVSYLSSKSTSLFYVADGFTPDYHVVVIDSTSLSFSNGLPTSTVEFMQKSKYLAASINLQRKLLASASGSLSLDLGLGYSFRTSSQFTTSASAFYFEASKLSGSAFGSLGLTYSKQIGSNLYFNFAPKLHLRPSYITAPISTAQVKPVIFDLQIGISKRF